MFARSRWIPATLAIVAFTLAAACSTAAPQSVALPSESKASYGNGPLPPAAAPSAPAAGAAKAPTDQLPSDQAVFTLRKIIYTGDVTLEATDVAKLVDTISRIVKDAGGYIATSSTSNQGDNQIATLSLRVPSDSYQDVLNLIQRSADKVRDQKTSSQDVSEEYADVDAQVRNLKATEAQYVEFLKKANTIDEVLKVQSQLTTVRGQIERLQGRLNFLDRRADLATINVSIYPPAIKPKTNPTNYANPIEAAGVAWEASIRFLAVGASAVISVLVFFWWAIPPLALLAIWLRGRASRRRPVTAT